MQLYREDLENPPLLVVCDMDRFEVHTNYTGTAKQVYAFNLADLAVPAPTETSMPPPLDVLRALFEDPERLDSFVDFHVGTKQMSKEQVPSLCHRSCSRRLTKST